MQDQIKLTEVSEEELNDGSDAIVNSTFEVRDDASANWLIRKIAEARSYAERCADWADREKRRAQHDEQYLLMRYGGQLANYVRTRIEETGGRRKSVSMPAGAAGFKTTPARLVVDDELAVINWAKQHMPELVITSEKILKSALADHMKSTGEMPDRGVHIEPSREIFFVK